MTEPMTTSIDKIREQVEQVRERHVERLWDTSGASPSGSCTSGGRWPCKVRTLAEQKLKLSEWISEVADRHHALSAEAERILAEVAE